MVKSIVTFCIVIFSILFSSCTLFYSSIGAYAKPKRESPETIKAYVGIEKVYDGLFVIKSDTALKKFVDSIGGSVPNVYIFNKNHQNIFFSRTCVWSNINQLDSLQNAGNWNIKESLRTDNLEKYLEIIDGKKPSGEYDFLVYYVWAKYSPKLSKKMLAKMGEDFRERKSNVYVGSINLDLQAK